jgi:hypothetical protein
MSKYFHLNGTVTPAVIIILLMVIINASVFFYFDYRSNKADEGIQNNVSQLEDFAKANRHIIVRLENERAIRTDQNCKLFEREHKKAVQDLEDTYEFLKSPVAHETPGLTRFIILNLPRTEEEARVDNAPEYCDNPGLGLKEPDPKIPERPHQLDELTRQITPHS